MKASVKCSDNEMWCLCNAMQCNVLYCHAMLWYGTVLKFFIFPARNYFQTTSHQSGPQRGRDVM